MQKNIKDLLQKYQQGKASKEELQDLLQLLDEENESLEEWMELNYIGDAQSSSSELLQPAQKQRVYDKIVSEVFVATPPNIASHGNTYRLLYRWAAVAACILLVIGVLFVGDKKPNINLSVAKSEMKSNPTTIKAYTNNTRHKETYRLADGSIVNLYPRSQFQYSEPFEQDKRSIWLTGKAVFDVAKDPLRPFTVYTGHISTTALGTKFIVDGRKKNELKIRLLEGKIWLRKEVVELKGWVKDLILVPGQQMNYNIVSGLCHVKDYNIKDIVLKVIPSHIDTIATTQLDDANTVLKDSAGYNFTQTNLSTVFKILAEINNVSIRFERKDIAGKRFSGKILFTDPLDVVLKSICAIHGLDYTHNETGIKVQPYVQSVTNTLDSSKVELLNQE